MMKKISVDNKSRLRIPVATRPGKVHLPAKGKGSYNRRHSRKNVSEIMLDTRLW